MHTHDAGKFGELTYRFFHNGDFSGPVELLVIKEDPLDPKDDVVVHKVELPMEVLESLVAKKVRQEAISEIEDMADEALLRFNQNRAFEKGT